jgi:hypothetical protein
MSHETYIDPISQFMRLPDAHAVLSRNGKDFILRTLSESAEQSKMLFDLGYRLCGAVFTLCGNVRGVCDEPYGELVARAVKTFNEQKRNAALNGSQRWLEALHVLEDPRR